jgi:hypothetical protein
MQEAVSDQRTASGLTTSKLMRNKVDPIHWTTNIGIVN